MVGHGKLRVRSAITRTVGFFGILALLAAALSTTADVPFQKIKRSRNSLHSFETIQNSRTSRKSANHVTSRNWKLTALPNFLTSQSSLWYTIFVQKCASLPRDSPKNPKSNLSFWRLPCVRHALQRGPQVPAGACEVIVGFRNVHSSFPQGSLCYPTYIAINKLAELPWHSNPTRRLPRFATACSKPTRATTQ